MGHRIYGYARVSSKDQNATRQIEALKQYPVEEGNIYLEKRAERILTARNTSGFLTFCKRRHPGD